MGIYVWGTGCGASELLEQGLELDWVAAFLDSFPSGKAFLGKPVLLPQELDTADCELLIITTRHADAVAGQCAALGIPEDRILFLKNSVQLLDRNSQCTQAEALLGKELLDKLLPRQRIVPTPAQLTPHSLPESDLCNDYVRLATLELLCRRLEAVPGAAAELGVYQGFFARCINLLLPQRTLYLFDSFAGFAPEANASEAFHSAHANTSISRVLSRLPHPEQAVVKPGFFPASLNGLEDRFCLVSLDVDFYRSTLDGLRYFWPRLNPGGCLMLHDWGSPSLPGVRQALADFEAELDHPLPSLPLCDIGGSLVLCKQ